MILIVAVDDNYGMAFHGRRQSQDRILRGRILEFTKNSRLWVNSYTKKQFTEEIDAAQIYVAENFLKRVSSEEFCFVENEFISFYENNIEKVFLFKWNKVYPADLYFDIDLEQGVWSLVSSDEFKGYSHDKITLEVYER